MSEKERTHKNVQEAILAVMEEVAYVQKDKAAGGVKYSIKSEEAVLTALRPAMVKHGLILTPVGIADIAHGEFQTTNSTWNRIVANFIYRFTHVPTETFTDVVVMGDGADSGDKAAYKAMTGSKKYALLETFLLITGDDPDLEASAERAPTGQARPFSPATLIRMLKASTEKHEKNSPTPSKEQRGQIVMGLQELLGEIEDMETFISRVFGKPLEQLPGGAYVALSGWMSDPELALDEAGLLLADDAGDYS